MPVARLLEMRLRPLRITSPPGQPPIIFSMRWLAILPGYDKTTATERPGFLQHLVTEGVRASDLAKNDARFNCVNAVLAHVTASTLTFGLILRRLCRYRRMTQALRWRYSGCRRCMTTAYRDRLRELTILFWVSSHASTESSSSLFFITDRSPFFAGLKSGTLALPHRPARSCFLPVSSPLCLCTFFQPNTFSAVALVSCSPFMARLAVLLLAM